MSDITWEGGESPRVSMTCFTGAWESPLDITNTGFVGRGLSQKGIQPRTIHNASSDDKDDRKAMGQRNRQLSSTSKQPQQRVTQLQ